jgi:thiosulfate/3-mercaptopyruvate sulfurtransferase
MKKFIALVIGMGFASLSFAATPLLTPAELKPLITNPAVRVIDVRPSKEYNSNHIPGAVSAPYGKWRGPATNPGELPPLAKLTALIQSLGLSPDTHAVVVSSGADSTDFGASARVYWTLKVLGLKDLSILNGGVKAWSAASLEQDRAAAKVAPSTYTPTLDQSLIASRDEVAKQIGNPHTRLIDARPPEFFNGDVRHPAAKISGTIHTAINFDNDKWFKPGTSTFVSAQDAQKIWTKSGIKGETEDVSFCNTGHWAATNWFAMSEVLGRKDVKLYPGSMVDWTQAPTPLAMDNVPSRGKQLVYDAKAWFTKIFQ